MPTNSSTPNRLIHETSPYLLEHAHNPVDWYAWGPDALAKAKAENKPLLISIGYAACHWCHVMEGQSFSDVEVANFMNKHFVCIKIDREERPDLDKIYMDAVQMINGSGGWPLNAFAMPDGRPFYGGTYFPKSQWMHLLQQIAGIWSDRMHDVELQADGLTRHIQQSDLAPFDGEPPHDLANIHNRQLLPAWASLVDLGKGGFNGAPKFVLPVAWEFLVQYYHLHQSPWALKAVDTTLTQIANGGIHDHLAGGFARYSVDDSWHVPHFEKMLYDNALLLSLYAHAYQINPNRLYKETAQQIVRFLKTDLQALNGCFLSSVNADSEGVEGRYYVWGYHEIAHLLPPHLLEVIVARYGITPQGNWENGTNILDVAIDMETLAKQLDLSANDTSSRLYAANQLLLSERQKRVKPSIDDKILTSWNAMAINGLIDLFKATQEPSLLQTATQCANTLCFVAMDNNGHLFHNLKNNVPSIDGFLEDYAMLAQAFTNLYQVTFNTIWLHSAYRLVNYVFAHFSSDQSPLFYFTANDSAHLVARKTEVMDNVTPSSNSVMAEVLLKLGTYFAKDDWVNHSLKMVQTISGHAPKGGPYYGNWDKVMGVWAYGPMEVVILGPDALARALEMQKHYLPLCIFAGGTEHDIPLLHGKHDTASTQITVCHQHTCQLPVSSVAEALEMVDRLQKEAK